ncbi:MAG: acetyl-CoA acetyltransferase [Deltaproteobacteria bacterium]|nr:acetyl-CoA acetyltransferase [Deltaproteobacteria bacterium]
MPNSVAIIGIGFTPARPTTAHCSFQEMMFETAQKAYLDAGVEANEIGSFVTCAEDLNEGLSIFDEYTPDQLGAVQKPMHTLTQDGLHGIADAVIQIRSGLVEIVVVEAHSKASNMITPGWLLDYALDPIYNRPLGFNPHALAGLEMNLFLHETGITLQQCSHVVAKNRTNALRNPAAAYPQATAPGDVEASPYLFYPLREAEMAKPADGCVVAVLAHKSKARGQRSKPIWVKGVGFGNDSPTIESRDWPRAEYARVAAEMAYRQAGIQDPRREIHLLEVDDLYAYKELQHLIALGLYREPLEAGRAVERGATKSDGEMPVNVSGGTLGGGWTLEAAGLYRIVELVLQLRGQAGPRQVPNAKVGLAQSWRGVPATSGAVVILGSD